MDLLLLHIGQVDEFPTHFQWQDCPRCNGTGKRHNHILCPECNGMCGRMIEVVRPLIGFHMPKT